MGRFGTILANPGSMDFRLAWVSRMVCFIKVLVMRCWIVELGKEGGAGNLIICEVVLMHIDEAVLDETKATIDTRKIDLVARMGGNWYCRATGDALFEIARTH